MKLFTNRPSPYGRMVLIAMHEKNLADSVEIVSVDPWKDPPELLAANPIGKVPALLFDSGSVLAESTSICEYFEFARPSPSIVGAERWEVMGRVGLARGLIDAAFTIVLERRRPTERQWQNWLARQSAAIRRTIMVVASPEADRFDLGDISLACALAYLDFRLPETEWRKARPDLADWLDIANCRPSIASTRPV